MYDFTVCLGRESRIRINGDHEEQNFRITLADTGLDTMTGGPLASRAQIPRRRLLHDDMQDGVSDIDIPRLLAFHKSHGKLATVTTFRPISRFGILNIDNSNQVLSFIEKPRSDAWASAGFFVFKKKCSITSTATNVPSRKSRSNVWRPNTSLSPTTTKASFTRWTRIGSTSS